jgi:hypothetical protein
MARELPRAQVDHGGHFVLTVGYDSVRSPERSAVRRAAN